MISCSHTLECTVHPATINQIDIFCVQLQICGLQPSVSSKACLKCVTLRDFGVYAQSSLHCVDASFLCACGIVLAQQHNRFLVL